MEGMIIFFIIAGLMIFLGIALSNKTWKYEYEGNIIIVKNTAFTAELLINNEIHDNYKGLTTSLTLLGKLDEGESLRAEISSGMISMNCRIYVNNQLLRLKSQG